MSDSLSAIADDEEDYLRLCNRYGEKPELMQGSFGKMVNPYGPHAKCLEERCKAEAKESPMPIELPAANPFSPEHLFKGAQTYQPEMITVRKDHIEMAIAAIYGGLEHTREALIIHDRDLGRTTYKNLSWARIIEGDIRQMEECLKVFKALP